MKKAPANSPQPQPWRRLGILATSALLVPLVHAEEIQELDPTTVDAEDPALTEISPPGGILVTDREIEFRQVSDLSDLFEGKPGIRVGGGHASAHKIYLRGIEDKQANIMIDGAPQSGYLSHHQGQYQVEPDLLKVVDVHLGPGSALLGPGALAGAVLFETKDAEDFLQPGQTFGGLIKGGYGSSADDWNGMATLFGRFNEDWTWLASVSGRTSDDYEDGSGRTIEYTASDQWRGFFKLNGNITDEHSVEFSYEHLEMDGTFRHRPNFYGFFVHPFADNIPVDNESMRDTFTFEHRYNPDADWINFRTKAYYTSNSLEKAGQHELTYDSYGIDFRNSSEWNCHELDYGMEYRHDVSKLHGGGSITGTFPGGPPVWGPAPRVSQIVTRPAEDLDILGFYIQDEWEINSKLRASFGGRVDSYAYTDYTGRDFDDTGASGNATLTYSPVSSLDLSASWANVFRGVTPMEQITLAEVAFVSTPPVNAASIDPETAEKFELSALWTSDSGFYARGAFYHQEIDDVIAVTRGVRDNQGTLETEGFELGGGYQKNNFNFSLFVDDANPELNGVTLTDTSFGLGTAYGRSWNADISYYFESCRILAGWTLQYVESMDDVPAGTPIKDSYIVNNLYLEWRPMATEDLTVNLSVNNIFDEFYYDHTTTGWVGSLGRTAGLPQPGRDIRLSATWRF